MSDLSQHSEWLSLIEVSGPFLAEPVLKDAFPQGLEGLDGAKKKLVRQAYDEWREAIDLDDPDALKIHKAWIELVLRQGLELDEDGAGDVLNRGSDLADIKCERPEHGVTLTPDFAVVDGQGGPPLMLVTVYEPQVVLSEALKQGTWSASPGERMVELCRATGVRLGLVTNGEQWMFVDAPVGAVTTFASWYGRLWAQEPITLQAFVSLLGIRRFFVDRSEQLPALLDNSLKYQDEVTDALGEQVRRAVEVLIQALDRAHVDSNRTLLEGVEPAELYEAGLTVMMRIVFLLSAEERGLLLLGDELYEANYAVSTLRLQLRAESEEILERRWDAWSRLLSLFRAVYGGIDHEALRLPALGGSLFDPDRFPFLEGRPRGSRWKVDMARPLPIDNRTVLLLLEAVQLFRGRTLSYMALDVEQIGYVYEGLLERTVVRAAEVTLDLDATKSAKNPWVTLPEIEDAAAQGQQALEKLFKERTESSASRVRNDLNKPVDDNAAEKLLTACHADRGLRDRVKPYFHFLRTDPWGYPLVYPKGTFMVASGSDRRETGTHYTPKSLTEAIVRETLEVVAYVGPSQGQHRNNWELRSPAELLDLKICDPAMGSGAFLVQVCRWLSERLLEAWAEAEDRGQRVTAEGEVVQDIGTQEPLRPGAEERLMTARRLIAERCLYGVDLNPLAVELAKLSIWLVTLAKGRPFGFLDHNLRCGDSLLGTTNLDQVYLLDLKTSKNGTKHLFASKIDIAIRSALELRLAIRNQPIRDIDDVVAMARLDEEARNTLQLPGLIADTLVGAVLAASGKRIDTTSLSIDAGNALEKDAASVQRMIGQAGQLLESDRPEGLAKRLPFHWPLEFPEVFSRPVSGFDAMVGNPPFLGGKKIAGVLGRSYLHYLISVIGRGVKGSADLVAFFFLRANELTRRGGSFGLIAVNSISEGGTREVGLEQIRADGSQIYAAVSGEVWPGSANVVTSSVHCFKGEWGGPSRLNGQTVRSISAYLTDRQNWEPQKLDTNTGLVQQGSVLLGSGFIVSAEEALKYLEDSPSYSSVLFPYLSGQDVNSSPTHHTDRWVVNFWDWPETKAEQFAKPLFDRLARDVVAERTKMKSMGGAADTFWRHLWYRSELYHLLGYGDQFVHHPEWWSSETRKPDPVLVFATGATKYPCFTFVPNKYIFANTLCVVPGGTFAMFAALSSDLHTIWAWEHGSKMKQDLRYTHGDVFETFPFPKGLLQNECPNLETLGRAFFESRRNFLLSANKGMTATYNDIHDPTITQDEITKLRELQTKINLAVLASYEYDDVELEQGFHHVDYLPEGKNLRFTVSESVRKDLLTRLAVLNKSRYEAENARRQNSKMGKRSPTSRENAASFDDLLNDGRPASKRSRV